MNILHVIEGVDVRLGGLSYLLANITNMEQLIGHTNEILSIGCPTENINKEIKSKLHLFSATFPTRFSNSQPAIDWLKSNIHLYDTLIIHSTWNILCFRASHVARSQNVPYVFWPHNSLDPFDLQKKNTLKSILGPLLVRKHLDGAVAICSASKLESDRLQAYGSRTIRNVLPYPVRFIDEGGERSRFREKYSLETTEFTFLFLSRVDYKKGLDLAIKAFSKLSKEIPTVKFIVAGPDTKGYSKYIVALIKELGLEAKISMIGALSGESKSDAFLGADCFILPSLNESFGIAVVESLQSGLPVLISNNVYIHEDIERLKAGWICTTEINNIYESMKSIIQNREEYEVTKKLTKKAGVFFSDLSRLKEIYTNFYLSL